MNNDILSIRNLKVSRGGISVLDIPQVSIHNGEFLSIIGPNGTGKSTLLLSIGGLVKRESGEISFHGKRIENGEELLAFRRRVAMVFQEPLLFDATVYDNVASGLKIRGISRSRIRPVVEENLALFGISHLSSRSARKISGGEAQRTSLARAFATDPEMILLDEPFASLDPPTKEAIIEDLSRVMKVKLTTAIMATHDRMDALRLSSRIAVMDGGRIVQIGTPSSVIHQPVNETVALFVGVETMLAGEVRGTSGGVLEVGINHQSIYGTGAFSLGERVMCFIRPESVMVFPADYAADSSARNVFPGTVTKIQTIGLIFRIQIDCGFPLSAHVTQQAMDDLHIETGMRMVAVFKATAVHVILQPEELSSYKRS
jgi:tungstate transport system ATP-binding protein